MVCSTPRLLIRPLTVADGEDFFAYRSDPVVTKFQSYHFNTLEDASAHIRMLQDRMFGTRGEWVQLGIQHVADNKVVGDIGLKPEGHDERVVEVGITLSGDYQGKGIAREALRGVLKALFNDYPVHRVQCYIDTENAASVTLFEKLGFRREGHTLQSFCNKGTWRDEYLYAVLATEWKDDSKKR